VTVQTTLCAAHLLEHDFGHARNDPRTQQFLDPMMNFMMRDESTFVQMSRSDPELVEAVRNIRSLSNQMAKALVAEGVTLVPGTDMPGSNVTQGFSLQEELRLMVEEVGIAPLDVLRSATVTSAQYHGEGGEAGQIVGGQRSDLVILSRDPSVDIRATAAIETVVLGRSLLTNEARERGISRAVERYKAMPVPVPAG
jgi:imidazolonepropionase-like amidohydrolase